jgi:hypothetical protein
VSIEIKLRGKHQRKGAPGVIGYKASARTGNSHGMQKSKLPAHEPCKRAPAGWRGAWHQPHEVPVKVMLVTYGGKKRMVTEAYAQAVIKGDSEAELRARGLT